MDNRDIKQRELTVEKVARWDAIERLTNNQKQRLNQIEKLQGELTSEQINFRLFSNIK